MKKSRNNRLRTILICVLTMLAAVIAFTACHNKTVEPDGPAATVPPQEREEYTEYTGRYGSTITLAANVANSINGYYYDYSHDRYILENPHTKIIYNLSNSGFNGLAAIENSSGKAYITETMDTYMRTAEGTTFYAAGSTARANLFDQGFYYYNLHLLDQIFQPAGNIEYDKFDSLELNDVFTLSDMEKIAGDEKDTVAFRVKSTYDPYMGFRLPDNKYLVTDYDAFSITLRCSSSDVQLFYTAGDNDNFTADAHLDFKAIPDGKYHTYTIYYGTGGNMTKYLKAFRLDVGNAVGETVAIKEAALIKLKGGTPQFKLDRNYNMYPDKVNENVRFVATTASTNIDAVGTITRIPVENVEKILIGDAEGDHESIDAVDWDTAVYVGFDIKDAGVFGIILGTNEKYCGKLLYPHPGTKSRFQKSKEGRRHIYVEAALQR